MERFEAALPRLVLGVSAILLLASLFMPWFGGGCLPGEICTAAAVESQSAWEAFRFADILLALAVPGALTGVAIADLFEIRWPYLGAALIGGGAICLALFAVYHPA